MMEITSIAEEEASRILKITFCNFLGFQSAKYVGFIKISRFNFCLLIFTHFFFLAFFPTLFFSLFFFGGREKGGGGLLTLTLCGGASSV